jgi:hypothetical protein
MRRTSLALFVILVVCFFPRQSPAQGQSIESIQTLTSTIRQLTALIEPHAGAPSRTFTTQLKFTKADGLPAKLLNATVDLAYQAPDRLRLTASYDGQVYHLARDGQELWAYVPAKKFGVVGVPGVQRFAADPNSIDRTEIRPFKLPVSSAQVMTTVMLLRAEARPVERINDVTCRVIAVSPPPMLTQALNIPAAKVELAVRETDSLPVRIRFSDGRVNAEMHLTDPRFVEPFATDQWKLKANTGDKIERVAVSHLTNFAAVLASNATAKIPTLGPARGDVKLVATSGEGRLELHDNTRVLFLKGTPQEIGRQHGELLRREIHDVTRRILYGVGVGSSFAKGEWFFGEIERASARLTPFISKRYFDEMDAMASASGMSIHESRLANLFPELFHCTGFAVAGAATSDGRLYHGRVLDYLRGIGLEQNAAVIILQPEIGNAWVNISYAGFTGSVTAMNAKHISIGEMGGRGEGSWDGKPMAQLVREVMEKASTLEEAVEIMRTSPRTCEYYYVIADGKTNKSVAIKATPTLFETVYPGESHPQLPRPVKDAVLLSADKRYDALVDRVQANFGKLDADGARALMEPPVCMSSNIHSVLFAPDTLDFWVANADSQNVASKTRYTHYNLGDLIRSKPPQ